MIRSEFAVPQANPMGWCPGARRPMMVKDGLLARLRPHLGRLSRAQALALCDLAERCGNGLIDFTTRANIQLRGVTEESHPVLLDALRDLDLLDPDMETEIRRAIMVTPFWQQGDDTQQMTEALCGVLHDLPELPPKFGFVVDLGERPVLWDDAGDIRLERGQGVWVLRADGAERGRAVTRETVILALIEMAEWFAERWNAEDRRMAQIVAKYRLPDGWQGSVPLEVLPNPDPGWHRLGMLHNVPTGQITADALRRIIEASPCIALRLTPWRIFLLENPASEGHT